MMKESSSSRPLDDRPPQLEPPRLIFSPCCCCCPCSRRRCPLLLPLSCSRSPLATPAARTYGLVSCIDTFRSKTALSRTGRWAGVRKVACPLWRCGCCSGIKVARRRLSGGVGVAGWARRQHSAAAAPGVVAAAPRLSSGAGVLRPGCLACKPLGSAAAGKGAPPHSMCIACWISRSMLFTYSIASWMLPRDTMISQIWGGVGWVARCVFGGVGLVVRPWGQV